MLSSPLRPSLPQDVCRELRVTDCALILPAVHKMAKVIAAVPAMERFIRDVCSVVLALDAPPQYAAATSSSSSGAAAVGGAGMQHLPSFDSAAVRVSDSVIVFIFIFLYVLLTFRT